LAAPPIRLRVETWDVGISLPGKENHHSVDISNTSTETWTLKRITPTCACATAELSSKTIRPGETAKLEVTYRAPRQDGKVSGHVMVDFTERNSAVIQLNIVGQVRSLFAADPPSVVFDQPPAGARASRTITLSNYSDQTIKIASIDAPEWVHTELRPVEVERPATSVNPSIEAEPRQVWEMLLDADPAKLSVAGGSVTVAVHSNSEEVGAAKIAVNLKPPVEANPDYLTFDTVESCKTGLRVVLRVAPALGELTEKDLAVTHDLGDELEVQLQKESANVFVLLVRLHPKRTSVVAEGDLQIRTNKSNAPPVHVKIAALVAAP
jgi:hypothetical protein